MGAYIVVEFQLCKRTCLKMTDDIPVSFIGFNEAKIKRVTITRALSADEIKHHRLRLGVEMFQGYDPEKHEFEVIRKNKD